jgi:hypothetical protein
VDCQASLFQLIQKAEKQSAIDNHKNKPTPSHPAAWQTLVFISAINPQTGAC